MEPRTNRAGLNLLVDVVAFIGVVGLTTTGMLMRYVLPPGSGHHATIWSLDRHGWGGIHFWIAMVFLATLAFHLTLHWRWVASVAMGWPRKTSRLRAGLGIVGLAVVLAFAVSPLLSPVEGDTPGNRASVLSSHEHENIAIRGFMTLQEVEETTGVPMGHIIKSLNLPKTLSEQERLGRLKQRYGFEIADVRDVVNEYDGARALAIEP